MTTQQLDPSQTPVLDKASWPLWLLLALLLLGTGIRFAGISDLSFYGDEETTAFAATSFLNSGKPAVPSGMDYNRAPLYTYMAAASARLLGETRELSYRLPALAFGVLAIALMWIGTRRLLGVVLALIATAFLATSEWHAVTSGYARMYSPYLALFMCTAYCFLEWNRARTPAFLAVGIALFLLSSSFQILSVFVVALLLLPHFLTQALNPREFWFDAAVAIFLAAGAIYLDGVLVQGAYSDFAVAVSGTSKTTVLGNVALFWVPLLQEALSGATLPIAILALLIAAVLLWRHLPRVSLPWNFAVTGLCLIGVLMLVLGQVYALVLCLYLLSVLATANGTSVRKCLLFSTVALALALGAAAFASAAGYLEHLTDPNLQVVFPYLALLTVKYPVLIGIALAAPLLAGHQFGSDSITHLPHDGRFTAKLIRVMALFFVLNLFAFGIFGRWYEDRYIVHTYPFLLVLAAYTLAVCLDVATRKLAPSKPAPLILAACIALCLLMPHHLVQGAWRAAAREHGDTNIENGRYFPDHASVGNYVRERLQPGDTVVATDVLQQRWYVGQADYWLRSATDVSIYVYEAKDGRIRDIYVNAELLNATHATNLLAGDERVWVVVSTVDVGEDWAFSAAERSFLDAVKARGELVFSGRDGKSAVYVFGGNA